jgi:hypothetical protein
MLLLYVFVALLALSMISPDCDKLFARTIERVFLGYSRVHKGYLQQNQCSSPIAFLSRLTVLTTLQSSDNPLEPKNIVHPLCWSGITYYECQHQVNPQIVPTINLDDIAFSPVIPLIWSIPNHL